MSYFWPKKGLVGPNLQKKKNSDKYSAFKHDSKININAIKNI